MYDLPPRRRISLILVKLGPAHRRNPRNPNLTLDGMYCLCTWPLHSIAITNIVWCIAYERRVGGGAYLAQ